MSARGGASASVEAREAPPRADTRTDPPEERAATATRSAWPKAPPNPTGDTGIPAWDLSFPRHRKAPHAFPVGPERRAGPAEPRAANGPARRSGPTPERQAEDELVATPDERLCRGCAGVRASRSNDPTQARRRVSARGGASASVEAREAPPRADTRTDPPEERAATATRSAWPKAPPNPTGDTGIPAWDLSLPHSRECVTCLPGRSRAPSGTCRTPRRKRSRSALGTYPGTPSRGRTRCHAGREAVPRLRRDLRLAKRWPDPGATPRVRPWRGLGVRRGP